MFGKLHQKTEGLQYCEVIAEVGPIERERIVKGVSVFPCAHRAPITAKNMSQEWSSAFVRTVTSGASNNVETIWAANSSSAADILW